VNLFFSFKTKIDFGSPLKVLYDRDLVKIAAAHQTDLFLSVSGDEPITKQSHSISEDDIKRRNFVQALTEEGVYRALISPVYKKDNLEHNKTRIRVWTTKQEALNLKRAAFALC